MSNNDNRPNSPPGKGLGQGMLIGCLALGLATMTFMFDGLLDRQRNPNRRPESAMTESGIREVILRRNRQGHYVSNITINDVEAEALLDTGATDVAVPANIASAAGLVRGYSGQAMTANGVTTVYATRIDELRIGNIIIRDVDASIMPNMGGDTILLGMSVLQHVEFTQSGDRLTLRQLPY